MKKILPVLLAVLFLSGCINITEEVFLEKNGSGKYVMTLDMEKMMEMMDMLKSFAPDSATAGKELDGSAMDSLVNTMGGDLSAVPGITEFKKEKQGKSTVVVSFRFRDIQALNDAMRKRNEKSSNKEDLYAFSKGSFEFRDTTNFGLNDAMKELNNAGSDSLQAAMEMVRAMMGDMTYTTIYHLPGKVKNISNKDAVISADGKTVTLKVNMMDRQKAMSLRNKVSYKK